ncbi:MAG: serine hydrolase, partial [Verrucomicrobia bacterium]|nr:serine hydrolase [Verrucomicrobiota bacterium]
MRLLLALLFLFPPLAHAEAPPPFSPEARQALDRAVTSAIKHGDLPGGVLWLEHRGQIYQQAYGHRSVEPAEEAMTLDTIFDAASLTKVIATTPAVLKLVEQGRLDLDEKVTRYLPEFTGDDNKARVTVRQLLTHCSGLSAGLRRGYEWQGYAHGIALACAEPSAGRAGLDYLYSDLNFILLGEIVHRIAQQPLNQFAAAQVFAPLGMTDTTFLPPADLLPRI